MPDERRLAARVAGGLAAALCIPLNPVLCRKAGAQTQESPRRDCVHD